MQVENLAIALRNRSNWEAIDLGFSLARKWFLHLWCAWLIGALPVFIIIMTLTIAINNETFNSLIFILFWWCKPLYEQPILYILSRQLFSEPVTLRDVIKNYINVVKPQLGALLLWRRLSLSRSFNNPVAMLEGITKKERRKRLTVLHAQQSNASQWLTIVCVHLELLLYLSFLFFAFSLIPSEMNNDFSWFELFDEENIILITITNIAYFLAISIIAPIYVAAGFSLYITRRVKLEGWDIELAFKRMKNRINGNNSNSSPHRILACIPFLLCILFSSFTSQEIYANEYNSISKQSAESTIEEVLKHEDFGTTSTKKQWVFIGSKDDKNKENELPKWLGELLEWMFGGFLDDDKKTSLKALEILIWGALGIFIIWLINKYSHWLSWINLKPSIKSKPKPIPNKLFGIEISQDSLPDDILAVFNNYIENKQYREALSLLYRASLSSIVHHGDIEILSSATEQECSNIVSRKREQDESHYFKELTRTWVMLAYAEITPSLERLSLLRDGWSKHYMVIQSEKAS